MIGQLGKSGTARVRPARDARPRRVVADGVHEHLDPRPADGTARRAARVPTPLAAFLSTQPWVPVRSHDQTLAFVAPKQAWLPPPAGEEEPPYVPLLVSAVRPILEGDELSPRLAQPGTTRRGEHGIRPPGHCRYWPVPHLRAVSGQRTSPACAAKTSAPGRTWSSAIAICRVRKAATPH